MTERAVAGIALAGRLVPHPSPFELLQVLEGPRLAVRDTVQRISKDSRHHRIVVLYESTISERNFPDWQMGFAALEPADADRLEGWSDFFFRAAGSEPPPSDMARRVLAAFRQGRWHALVE